MQYLKLKKYREKRGLTLSQLAELTHYSRSTINHAELGNRNFKGRPHDVRRDEFWRVMSEFFDVPVDELKEVIKE